MGSELKIGLDNSQFEGTVVGLLNSILAAVLQLKDEVSNMADSKSLDQAVDDLGGAVAGKIAEDQVLRQQAAVGRNTAADVAKVEAEVAALQSETTAEQAEDGTTPPAPAPAPTPTPTPAPAPAPTPVVDVTVTGTTPSGVSVPEAPVSTAPAAPVTQQLPTTTP